MDLNKIKPAAGSKHAKRRVGRGIGSGLGKTAGRGHKGQSSRAGGYHKVGFEGGQMPLHMRLPKLKGFKNPNKVAFQVVSVAALARLFPKGGEVSIDDLVKAGAVRKGLPVKVLAQGELKVALTVKVRAFSKKAAEKIATAGGQAITG